MADSRHFEKPLNRHNSAVVRWITVKFGMITHFDPLKANKILNFQKSKRWTLPF